MTSPIQSLILANYFRITLYSDEQWATIAFSKALWPRSKNLDQDLDPRNNQEVLGLKSWFKFFDRGHKA